MAEEKSSSLGATELFNAALSALLYGDGERRPLTHKTLRLIEDAVAINPSDGLLLVGIMMMGIRKKDALKHFQEAEEKGSSHPLLYYYLGECYRLGNFGVRRDEIEALMYYEKCIAGRYCRLLSIKIRCN